MTRKTAAEVRAELERIRGMVHEAEAKRAVAGIIPQSVLDAIESALKVVVPLTAFLGDFELTTLLSGLKVWLNKKKVESQQADAHRNEFNDMGYDSYWM